MEEYKSIDILFNNKSIVNTCSVASFGMHHGFTAHVNRKHVMIGINKINAWELGPEIRCNGIAPGLIHTAMVDSMADLEHYSR
jgi:NAD(P)-dependent dehydrogenase (short-subunit alcohol dehydrogenase family)